MSVSKAFNVENPSNEARSVVYLTARTYIYVYTLAHAGISFVIFSIVCLRQTESQKIEDKQFFS